LTLVAAEPVFKPDLGTIAPRSRPSRPANATLVAREDLGATMGWFRFHHDHGPSAFTAGQYVPITMADEPIPPRPYSVASSPSAPDLDFVISLVAGGTLTPRLFGLRIGDRVSLGAARGLFRLDDADQRDHLLIGTGSGIAPLLSMISVLRARSVPPRTFLLHGARVREELATPDVVESGDHTWLSYRPTLSRVPATKAWTGRRGRVGVHLDALLLEGAIAPERTVAYLCGSPAMIEGCRIRLAALGLPPEAIRSERFVAG
jgi:ferredoxin-NADP reductase